MNVKLIGIGAAGNKAAINAVENNVISIEHVLLINSTLKDIPADYKGRKVEYAGSYGGCGKERNIAKDLVKKNIMDDILPLEEFLCLNDETKKAEVVVIVTSTEGGTGSGSSVLLGQFIQNALGIQVHMFGFAGFQADVRGLKNTVEWFQELEENFAVECIENSKFLPECRNNKIKAERMANVEFGKKLGILMGNPLRNSSQNIDATDLLKIVKTPGFMFIESTNFERIKNKEQFENMLIEMIDNSKSIDVPECKAFRTAVIINIKPESTDYISFEDILLERYGNDNLFESFLHIQYEADMPEFIAVIAAGAKMPVEQIQKIYNEYKVKMSRIDRGGDQFFAAAQSLKLDDDSDLSLKTTVKTVSKEDFFKNLEKKEKEAKKTDKLNDY